MMKASGGVWMSEGKARQQQVLVAAKKFNKDLVTAKETNELFFFLLRKRT
jgi:hypothetical protein